MKNKILNVDNSRFSLPRMCHYPEAHEGFGEGGACSLIFPVLLFQLAQFLMIPMEEKKMEQVYGEQYDDYRRRVGR
jgi:hypothetical protein